MSASCATGGSFKFQCEYHSNPLGIENSHPHFCRQLNAAQRNVTQTAYRILVSDNVQLLKNNTGNIWDSKKVNSNQSLQITYAGKKLQPAKKEKRLLLESYCLE